VSGHVAAPFWVGPAVSGPLGVVGPLWGRVVPRLSASPEYQAYDLGPLASPPPMNRGALTHDDRIDAVAGAVAHFQRAMMMDVDQADKAMRDEEINAEIEDFLEGFNQPTYRGMRVNGQRVAAWSSRDGWSGDTRPDAEWLQ
jgi:hypothetical protein